MERGKSVHAGCKALMLADDCVRHKHEEAAVRPRTVRVVSYG